MHYHQQHAKTHVYYHNHRPIVIITISSRQPLFILNHFHSSKAFPIILMYNRASSKMSAVIEVSRDACTTSQQKKPLAQVQNEISASSAHSRNKPHIDTSNEAHDDLRNLQPNTQLSNYKERKKALICNRKQDKSDRYIAKLNFIN